MKKVLLVAIIPSIVFFSCKKENANTKINATLIGQDVANCACYGGIFIVLGDSANGSTILRIDSVPPSSGIDLYQGPYPIDVTLTYTIDNTRCPGWYIKTDDIRRR